MRKLTNAATAAGGAYSVLVEPLENTVYTTEVKHVSSSALSVVVRPRPGRR